MARSESVKLLAGLLFLFILAQLVGIYTGTVILRDVSKNPYVTSLVVTEETNDPMNAVLFIGYVLAGAVIMIVLIRKLSIFPIIFRLMEFWLIASSSSIVFYSVLRFFSGYEDSMMAGIAMGIAFSILKFFRPELKNAAAMLATAGVGVIFGISLGLFPLLLFLILLSIYDFLSVFATKHMVEMADFVVKKDLAFTITSKAPPVRPGEKEQRIDLGTGDMIAPVMLEVATLPVSPVATACVFFGAVVSLGLFLVLVWRKKTVLPALPPIVLGMILSLLLGFMLKLYSF